MDFFNNAGRFIAHSFKTSACFAALQSATESVSRVYGKSATHGALTLENIESGSEKSVFYRIFSAVCAVFLKITDALFANLDKVKNNSAFDKVLKKGAYGSVVLRAIYAAYNFICSYTGLFSLAAAAIFLIPHDFWNNSYALLVSLFMAFIVLCAHASGRENVRIKPEKMWLCFIVFIVSTVFSSVMSKSVGDSVRVLAFFVTSFVMCMSESAFLCSREALRRFTALMHAVTVITGAVAVIQGIIGVEADASLTDLTLNSDMPGRVYSTLENPNNYAEFLVLFLPFAFVYALNTEKKGVRAVLMLLLAIPFAALLLTYSRSGWIAFAAAAIVFIVLYDKRLIPIFIIIGIAAIPFLPQSIFNRILTIGNLSDSSSSYRLDIWAGCMDMLKKWWYTGVGLGPGAFKAVYPPYAYGKTCIAPHSHMLFMEVLIETGIVGFLSYLLLTFNLIKRSCISAKRKKAKWEKNLACACAASMSGIILIGFFEYCWFYPRVMFAFFICAGITMAITKEK